MSARTSNPFSTRTVLGMLLFGAVAFLLMLYFIGVDETGTDTNNGAGHAAAKGLNGYAALVRLTEKTGYTTSISRNEGGLNNPGLLILTPPHEAKPEELTQIVSQRRYAGPTLVVLPKWMAEPVSPKQKGAKPGWVDLFQPQAPNWPGFLDELTLHQQDTPGWHGAGMAGKMPAPKQVLSGSGDNLIPLVSSDDGQRVLAGVLADDGQYPALYQLAGFDPDIGGGDEHIFPIVVVFDPDLLDNYGMNQKASALMASQLIGAANERSPPTITFDLTQNGLGKSMNLLTLAFTPPFVAATLCLIIAGLVVAWRAFRRFGPPVAEHRAIAFGKRQLVENSAGFIRRLNLLGPPYATLMRRRIAHALGLQWRDDNTAMDERIQTALAARGDTTPPFAGLVDRLDHARNETELLRAAEALKQIERMLGK